MNRLTLQVSPEVWRTAGSFCACKRHPGPRERCSVWPLNRTIHAKFNQARCQLQTRQRSSEFSICPSKQCCGYLASSSPSPRFRERKNSEPIQSFYSMIVSTIWFLSVYMRQSELALINKRNKQQLLLTFPSPIHVVHHVPFDFRQFISPIFSFL